MKKSLIALAALGAFAGAASAQSSVTLFGVLDTGVRAVRNDGVGTVKSLTSDGLASSRLGFRGEEDLGGGLKAGFWLEGRVGVDTGETGYNGTVNPAAVVPAGSTVAPSVVSGNGANTSYKFFNRRSTISLMGPFGEVRLGRDYLPTFGNLSAFDVYGAVGLGNILNLTNSPAVNYRTGTLESGGNLVRADNSIGYFLPSNLGGLYGQLMVAAGENTNQQNGNNRYIGGRVGYAAGPFDVAVAYGSTRIPGSSDYRVGNVGGSFNFGIAKLSALYHRAEWSPAGAAQINQKIYAIGANVPLGQGEFRATYQHSDLSGGAAGSLLSNADDARQYALGYIYNLSKRTALYTDVSRLQNRGGSRLTIPGGNAFAAGVGGRNSTAFALGVRHSF